MKHRQLISHAHTLYPLFFSPSLESTPSDRPSLHTPNLSNGHHNPNVWSGRGTRLPLKSVHWGPLIMLYDISSCITYAALSYNFLVQASNLYIDERLYIFLQILCVLLVRFHKLQTFHFQLLHHLRLFGSTTFLISWLGSLLLVNSSELFPLLVVCTILTPCSFWVVSDLLAVGEARRCCKTWRLVCYMVPVIWSFCLPLEVP